MRRLFEREGHDAHRRQAPGREAGRQPQRYLQGSRPNNIAPWRQDRLAGPSMGQEENGYCEAEHNAGWTAGQRVVGDYFTGYGWPRCRGLLHAHMLVKEPGRGRSTSYAILATTADALRVIEQFIRTWKDTFATRRPAPLNPTAPLRKSTGQVAAMTRSAPVGPITSRSSAL